MWTNCRLILFTRYPEPGKTKTRLVPELGGDGAALLQKKLTEKIVAGAKQLEQELSIPTSVHYIGGSSEKMRSWLGPLSFVEQSDGDLGQKMRSAFEQTFRSGAGAAILIGSDIPDITTDLLQQAFSTLQTEKVVIGPSLDGGYYLIGFVADLARQLLPLLFDNMRWSTRDLFSTTVRRLEVSGFAVTTLDTLRDIDLPGDLPFAREKGLL